jgi:hypothetical protein
MVVYTEEEVIEATDKAVADALKQFVEKCRSRIQGLTPDLSAIAPEHMTGAEEGHKRGANEAYWVMHDVLTGVIDPID